MLSIINILPASINFLAPLFWLHKSLIKFIIKLNNN